MWLIIDIDRNCIFAESENSHHSLAVVRAAANRGEKNAATLHKQNVVSNKSAQDRKTVAKTKNRNQIKKGNNA